MQPTARTWSEHFANITATLCYACLSAGRKLYDLGEYSEVFREICTSNVSEIDSVYLCWECKALLKKVVLFKRKVELAQRVLQCHDDFPGSLSVLAVHSVIQESYPKLEKFDNEHNQGTDYTTCAQNYNTTLDFKSFENLQKPVKEEIDVDYEDELDNNDFEQFSEYDNLPVKFLKDLTGVTVKKVKSQGNDVKIKIKKEKSMERTKHYKMSRLKVDKVVRKIPIKENEVGKFLELEKNGDYFKKIKKKCYLCISKIRTNLKDHKRKFHSQGKSDSYNCTICQGYFSSQDKFQLHINEHYVCYRCDLCEYSCYNKYNMTNHVKKHNKIVQCLECEGTFGNTREFFVHYRNLHTEFICDYCGKRVRLKNTLQRHIYKKHTTHRCEQCNITFSSYLSHREHYRLKHKLERSEASYCVQCNLQFDTVPLFRRHVQSSVAHSAERRPKPKKTYQCISCPKVYAKRFSMMNHYKKEHANKPRFYCNDCDKGFLNSTRYKDHMRYKHEGLAKERNSICYVCGRGFFTNRILSNHMRTHTGERPFECSQCDARFSQKVALQSHVKFIHLKRKRKTDSKGE